MELTVWPSDFGLISFDPECIRHTVYMKFAGVPFHLHHCSNPLRSITNSFPVFKDEEFTFTDFSATVEHLRFKRYSLDFGLSTKSCSEMLALISLLKKMLLPLSEFVFWMDKRNYEELTRPWYTKAIPAVISIFYLKKRKQNAVDLLSVHYPALENELEIHTHLKTVARDCFEILSTRLGEDFYFYGASPSSLDCMVYAYLAPLIQVPLPSNEIVNILNDFPKLGDFVNRIDEKYFPEVKKKVVVFSEDDERSDASYKMKFFTLTFVICAMAGYAVSNKIVSVSKFS